MHSYLYYHHNQEIEFLKLQTPLFELHFLHISTQLQPDHQIFILLEIFQYNILFSKLA